MVAVNSTAPVVARHNSVHSAGAGVEVEDDPLAVGVVVADDDDRALSIFRAKGS